MGKTISSIKRITDYAESVLGGDIIAGPYVRGSCQRYIDDLAHGHERGLSLCEASVDRIFRFYETILKLNGGQFEGAPFLLHESQAFKVGNIFGWKKANGTRRFTRAYIEEGKGNGKSPLVAGMGLYGTVADGEWRAEVYAAASKRDQAMVHTVMPKPWWSNHRACRKIA